MVAGKPKAAAKAAAANARVLQAMAKAVALARLKKAQAAASQGSKSPSKAKAQSPKAKAQRGQVSKSPSRTTGKASNAKSPTNSQVRAGKSPTKAKSQASEVHVETAPSKAKARAPAAQVEKGSAMAKSQTPEVHVGKAPTKVNGQACEVHVNDASSKAKARASEVQVEQEPAVVAKAPPKAKGKAQAVEIQAAKAETKAKARASEVRLGTTPTEAKADASTVQVGKATTKAKSPESREPDKDPPTKPAIKAKARTEVKAETTQVPVGGRGKAQAEAEPQAPEVRAGDRVQLVGLESCADLNGLFATLIQYDAGRERWKICIDGQSVTKNVRTSNVQKVGDSDCATTSGAGGSVGAQASLGKTSAAKRKAAKPGLAKQIATKFAKAKITKQSDTISGAAEPASTVMHESDIEPTPKKRPRWSPSVLRVDSNNASPSAAENLAGTETVAATPSGRSPRPKGRPKGASKATKPQAPKAQAACPAKSGLAAAPEQDKSCTAQSATATSKQPGSEKAKAGNADSSPATAPAVATAAPLRRITSKFVQKIVAAKAKVSAVPAAKLKPTQAKDKPTVAAADATKAATKPSSAAKRGDEAKTASAASSTPPKRQKCAEPGSTIETSPVALLIRRLSDPDALDVPLQAPLEAKPPAAKSKEQSANNKAAAAKPAVKAKAKSAGKPKDDADDDDDHLFNDAEELEGEEEVSDWSDAGVPDDDEENLEDLEWESVGALQMPPDLWPANGPQPGQVEFNGYASTAMAKAKLGSPSSPFAGLGMRLHQESAAFLLHPCSPCQRLLVDHATGTGKTLIILRMLDNYFDDPRPKVVIFPKDRVCDNFYLELLKWPTRWRHYFCFNRPSDGSLASGAKQWQRKKNDVWDLNNERIRAEAKTRGVRLEKIIRDLIDSVRDVLEMKNSIRNGKLKSKEARIFLEENPGAPLPRAPLRAFRFTTAGGGACELGRDGWPQSPILKVGFDTNELNPYSGKIVIMDECHNLVRPTPVYEEQLGRLRIFLHSSTRTVLAGFTGTPVGNEAKEGRLLLEVIKGEKTKEFQADEGFISSFHARGSDDFPREVPVQGVPDGVLHEGMLGGLIKRHSMHGEALKRYLLKDVEFQITPRLLLLPEEKRLARLANYCNMHVHYGSYFGKNREHLLANVKDHAPKFHGIAKSVAKGKEKAVVMLTREMGYKVLLEVLRKTGKNKGFKVATLDELSDFNDPKRNLRGERFRVMVVESSQAGEGVQFKHVRRLYLVDVPLRHSDVVQRASRCVRMGGHQELPVEERQLAVEMHLVQFPKFLRQGPPSLIYRELLNAKDVLAIPGSAIEQATEACMEELKRRNVKTLMDLQRELQLDTGKKLIELLTETALEKLGETSAAPARPLGVALWRLKKGGDDVTALEKALLMRAQVKTADDLLLDKLMDKSVEILGPLEAIRLKAVDRQLLAHLGDPPKAPPPRHPDRPPADIAPDDIGPEEEKPAEGEDEPLDLEEENPDEVEEGEEELLDLHGAKPPGIGEEPRVRGGKGKSQRPDCSKASESD
eukprot:TRINITY_DN72220_c0_g1_i1.p1 TRINITY_DN72220_c0_g1~~TRINITY_DN72220_c0_g1_i1.p1  ORF type:complete len:1530 (-),score=379.41 TRINITY_DN72220_c0_g1_i1:273-4862(-)